MPKVKAEITVAGFVQGVGFRYFVYRKALALQLTGFVQNLFTGEVYSVVEGEKFLVEDLIEHIKIGTSHSDVKKYKVEWSEYKGEYKEFSIRNTL